MNYTLMNNYYDLSLNIAKKYINEHVFFKLIYSDIKKRWMEEHRYYHTTKHLYDIIKKIESDEKYLEHIDVNIESFIIAAIFHDIVYDPTETNNEDESIKLMYSILGDVKDYDNILTKAECLIFATSFDRKPTTQASEIFWSYDNDILTKNVVELIKYEELIFKEFQWVDYSTYKEKRIEFLNKRNDLFGNENIDLLIEYIKGNSPTVGVYAGSFNPFHLGHLNILQKSKRLFDKVIVAFGSNPEKDVNDKKIPKCLKYTQTETYTGLLSDYIIKLEKMGLNVTLIRGLRNGADLDYETNQLRYIKDMKEDVKFVYLACDKDFEHISSSAIRNLNKYNNDLSKKYLP